MTAETDPSNNGPQPSPPGQAQLWQVFANPADNDEFCRAWLALLCQQMPGVRVGVLLVQAEGSNSYTPVAAWPPAVRDLSFFAGIAQQALTERRGVVSHPQDGASNRVHVAYPLESLHGILGAVVLDVEMEAGAQVQELLRQLHWNMGWLHLWHERRERRALDDTSARIASVMEILATALRQVPLHRTLLELVNELARIKGCSRVAIGLAKHGHVRVAALSHSASFERQSELVKLYSAAMEETADRLATTLFRTDGETDDTPPVPAHAALAGETAAHDLMSVPLLLGTHCIGVLTFERGPANPTHFTTEQIDWAETLAALLPAVIDLKRMAERSSPFRLADESRAVATRLFGPRHLVWKFGALITLALVATLALVETEYRVTTRTVIEGEIQRSAVAPFEGFLANSHARAGDVVKRGQVLCELDTRDLLLERQRWTSDRGQQALKLREARAKHELAAIQSLTAKLEEADAQLSLVNERIARARITAPFDGIVISGDLSQLIGSPVEQGKTLFEVAPLEVYRVILQVDEREIRSVQPGQRGMLVISGIAGDAMPFTVVKLTPIATAEDGRNFFRVEARLESTPPRLRPGMEGVGKIEVGKRRLWWILTHTFFDWLRVTLWTWTP